MSRRGRWGISTISGGISPNQSSEGYALTRCKHYFTKIVLLAERRIK
jgi:hypothetical protein